MLSPFSYVIRMQCIIGDSTIWIRIGYGPKGIIWTGSDGIYFLREQWKTYNDFMQPMVLQDCFNSSFGGGSQELLVSIAHCFDSANRGGIDHLMKLMLMDKTTRTWLIC